MALPAGIIARGLTSHFHLPAPLGSTGVSRFVATTGALTPALLFWAPGQVSLVHEPALPAIPSPTTPCAPAPAMLLVQGWLGHRFALGAGGGSSDFAHGQQSRQSHEAVSSLCRNPHLGHCSTDYPFTSSCSPPRLAATQLPSTSGARSNPA